MAFSPRIALQKTNYANQKVPVAHDPLADASQVLNATVSLRSHYVQVLLTKMSFFQPPIQRLLHHHPMTFLMIFFSAKALHQMWGLQPIDLMMNHYYYPIHY